jgi:hypothetical protein
VVVDWFSDTVEILAVSKAANKLFILNMARIMDGKDFLKLDMCFRIEEWVGGVTSITCSYMRMYVMVRYI